MGKNKKKSKGKTSTEKTQVDSQSSVTQEPKPPSPQIDIEPSELSQQVEENTKDSDISNTEILTEKSVEDPDQRDMKRGSSTFSEKSDFNGSGKRRNIREFSNSKYKSDRQSNFDKGGNTYKPPDGRNSEHYKRTNENEDGSMKNKRMTWHAGSNSRGSRDNSNNRSFRNNRYPQDEEFSQYRAEFDSHQGKIKYIKVREIVSDLFEVPEDHSLAHCVAEDMNMGSGIAVQFRYRFKRVSDLLNQQQKTGGLAILEDKGRYIYYLVTKQLSVGKPTYRTLFSSLKRLREHVIENGVKKIAMPRIGCGLDRLEWENVKFMIEFLFKDVDVEIVVCNLEPTADSSPQRHRNCRVTNVTYPIQDIEAGTVILYFSSEDEFVSEEMKNLDEKFHFLRDFKYARKNLGSVIINSKNKDYLLCGCIVKKSRYDPFDFKALQRCLVDVQKENKKNQHYYFGFQAMRDPADSCLNHKIINILRNSLRDVEVYVCWPGDLQNDMTPRDRFFEGRDRGLERESSFNKGRDRSKSGDRRSYPVSTPKAKTEKDWRAPSNFSWANEVEQNESLANSSFQEQSMDANSDWFQSENQQGNVNQEQIMSSEKRYTPPLEVPQNDSWNVGEDNLKPSSNEKEESSFEVSSINENVNYEYESFQKALKIGIDCTSIKEHPSFLPTQFSRVCFAREDLVINYAVPPGPDIDDQIGKLLNQNEKAGGVAYLKEGQNFLYCLIVNGATNSPTSQAVFSAIQKLRDHATKNRVKTLAIPKINKDEGDFKWANIKSMFQFLLEKHQIEMVVASSKITHSSASLMQKNSNKIAHVKSPIHQMKKKSAIIYLASADGAITEEMDSLAKKFDFKEEFQKKRKVPGDVIRYKQNEDHVLYGCVVKRTQGDRINFEDLQRCLRQVDQQNTEKLSLVGIQAVNDESGVNFKIATVLLNCLHDVTINMCWPGDLRSLMPGKEHV